MSRAPNRPVAASPSPQNIPSAPQTNWRAAQRGWAPAKSRQSRGGLPWWGWLVIGGGVTLLALAAVLIIMLVVHVGDTVSEAVAQAKPAAEPRLRDQSDEQLQTEYDVFIEDVVRETSRSAGDDSPQTQATQAALRSMRDDYVAYITAAKRLDQAGGFDPKSLKTKEDLDLRLGWAREMSARAGRLATATRDLPNRFRQELADQHLSAADMQQEVEEFGAIVGLDRLSKLQDQEKKIGEYYLQMLEILRREWGKWRVDQRREHAFVVFSSSSAQAQYEHTEWDLISALQTEEDMQQEVFGQMMRRQNPRGR